MQLAAGITPLNESGTPVATEIIPIIIDPHRSNEDLKRTENLLKWYRQIRNSLYGDRQDVGQGFFSVKISSLKDIVPNSPTLSDTFLFNIDAVGSKTFPSCAASPRRALSTPRSSVVKASRPITT